jgi:putative tricarboxylic transport membrane protein
VSLPVTDDPGRPATAAPDDKGLPVTADPPVDPPVAGPASPEAGPVAGIVAGVVLVVAGVALFARAMVVGADRGITLGGPTTAPIVVTALWVVVAIAYLVTRVLAWRRLSSSPPAEVADVRWRVPFLLLAALVGYAVVLKYTVVGYVLATVIFYVACSLLLNTRPVREVIVRDVIVAVGLSVTIYLVFTRLLGIVLPAGVLPL